MIVGIERKWFGDQVAYDSQRNVLGSAAVITLSSLRGVFLITAGAWALALIIRAVIWFHQRQRGHDTQQSYDTLAELAVEHVDADSRDPDERVVWTIGRDSHLVLRLLGNPPPQPAPSDEEPEPERQPQAALGDDKAGEEPEMPLQEQEVPDSEGGEFRR
jgi:ionotropic glutamate receptor